MRDFCYMTHRPCVNRMNPIDQSTLFGQTKRVMAFSSLHVSALLEAVGRAGVDVSGRIAAAASSIATFGDLDTVEAAPFEELVALCLAEANDSALGLAMGETASLMSLGLTEGLSREHADLREVFETFNARFALVVDAQAPTLSLAGDQAVLSFPVEGASDATRRLRAEYGVALGLLVLRAWAGPFATPRWVSFPHAAPSYVERYQRLFGSMVRFGAEQAAIGLSAELLHAKAYPWGRQLFRPASNAEVVTTHARIPERVSDFLASCRSSKPPDMAEIAAHLGMLERTLRRRLAAQGVRFRQLSDEARRTRALAIALDRMHSPADMADTLGFSKVTAFCRAFKRWTGLTLSEYRALHLRGPDADPQQGCESAMR
jgi:AraC-like DNA-binding protein